MVNTFMAETERNLEQNKSRARMAKYAEMLETQVKEANMKLESAERLAAIGETAAMVGHDIRNPLQSIVGELYLQKQDIASLPEGATKKSLLESIQSIEENVFYINKIVSDLQDFAKPIKVENQEEAAVDLNTILLDTLSIVPFSDLVQVEVFIDSDFPALAINQQVLKRALTNLITNALQAMPDGGRLTIRGVCAEDKAEISVEDTGTGIPDEVKSRMFQPLFTTKAKGQGLGLAVVKRLIEAQNGTVTFESQEGHGTKFILQLPTKKTSPAQ
jgi:signal transduction histidine kinase